MRVRLSSNEAQTVADLLRAEAKRLRDEPGERSRTLAYLTADELEALALRIVRA